MSSSRSFFNLLKSTLWHRRLSLTEQQMTIRTYTPLPLRLIAGGSIAVISSAITWAVIDPEPQAPGPATAAESPKAGNSNEQIDKLRVERDQLSATVNAAESQLNIERSTQKQLMMQVKSLEADKVKLKEELAFFESVLPTDTAAQGISIRRLKADVIAPNKVRYQLLVMQGGKGDKQFSGSLQIAVSVIQGGKAAIITFTDGKAVDVANFKLAFKQYQRVDGTLTLPDGVSMKSVQARILENGQQRTQLSVNL